MFKKVLIANRGAIACRILRTLKRLDVESVAVYAESDINSLHVRLADEAYSLGEGNAADTYLAMDKILNIAKQTGVEAIHPGYGFLSENANFVRRCESAGIVFIGPRAEHIEDFGLKHKARQLATKANVPLLPGSALLNDLSEAKREAALIAYPVMLKSTAGGGGIGMQLCNSEVELCDAFDSVRRLGSSNFANDGIFLEKYIQRARHIEVQVFGDGKGNALAIGERDCSAQRRNQKVVEECPAPNLNDAIREKLYSCAEDLLCSASYQNAGTVEFLLDASTNDFYFLEVNTRLQVEHGVTEEVYGLDLVEWMLRQASSGDLRLEDYRATLAPQGHAIQVRIYAEDAEKNFQPSAGLLSQVSFPHKARLRIDHWIESGIVIPPYFDPMLAKLIVTSSDRESAIAQLQDALAETTLYGCETNLDYLAAICADEVFIKGEVSTRYLNEFQYHSSRIDVLQGGTQTTIQDYPGRSGYWHVGVPPSGPFDNYSFRLANRLLGNASEAAALEITLQGPSLQFRCDTQVLIGGAQITALLDGKDVPMWQSIEVKAGQTLRLGRLLSEGARSYLAVAGGFQCPQYLGSRATFTLGQFGGHNGRALQAGDVLPIRATACAPTPLQTPELLPAIRNHWQIRVISGPHGAPDFFTEKDIETFFNSDWEVHYNSSRTGVRLIGPRPEWARENGGEAGLHPSNIHDNAYAFGTVDFTGDMPVILGPDGPSLGGFVCPATVIQADLWKLGQLRAGDKIRFKPVSLDDAVALESAQQRQLETLQYEHTDVKNTPVNSAILDHLAKDAVGEDVVYRAAGDHFLLVEYGEHVLDIRLRFRAHALMQWLRQNSLKGLKELTPGIRSLQIHFDSQQISHQQLLTHLKAAERALSQEIDTLTVPTRIVHLPLSWDDEACQLAIEKYSQSVRQGAPWCPSNLEFIRRINGLDSIADVKQIVFDASYLVMGLGDVYLGAPVATPVDPRHRLVTTKYNPARTWTAENSVGIGGSYLCVYGMEGPGGYQFVGRTLQMWNKYRKTAEFEQPWLLRFFDQIRFFEVSSDEMKQIRKDFPQGRYSLRIEEGEFNLADYTQLLEDKQTATQAFREKREAAFAAELAHWHATDQFNYVVEEASIEDTTDVWPDDSSVVSSPVSGSIWQTHCEVGDAVEEGDLLMVLESMKMEIEVYAPCAGSVTHLLLNNGSRINTGQALIVINENTTRGPNNDA